MNTISKNIQSWAIKTFGPVNDWDLYINRIIEELEELRISIKEEDRSNEEEEFSDVLILLLRAVAERKIDIDNALKKKMTKNKEREWNLNGKGIGWSIK